MKRIAVATVLVPLALVAACSTTPSSPSEATITPAVTSPAPLTSSPASSASASGSPSPRPTTTVTASTGSSDLPPPTGTKQVQVKHPSARPPLVMGVRLAAHQGYDRVVIDLRGPMTGYTVDWVKQIVQDGSGEPIDVKGGAYLQASLTPASAHTEEGKPTWGGAPVLQADLTNVRGVVRAGDFEGVVTVALVLRHRAAFRVIEQSNPSRLVIDVAH